jgi:peptidoglycan glycosyltransferase
MTSSLKRVGLCFLLSFFAVAASLGYWSVIDSGALTGRVDNPRRVEFEQGLHRGSIYDRNDTLLAYSEVSGSNLSGKPVFKRQYPQPEAVRAVGYLSLIYGTGGVEEGYDPVLRGDDRLTAWEKAVNQILHQPQRGSDIRITLDLPLESRLIAAMKRFKGAAIVIEVPSGAVRAMISLPSFDPNSLDQNFEALAKAPDAPLLNRVTQGLYQPGGALQTVVLSALLSSGSTLNTALVAADEPVRLGGLTLACAVPNQNVDTLQDAYTFGCARPFADAALHHQIDIQNSIDAYGLTKLPRLTNIRTVAGPPAPALFALANDELLLEAQGAGQGQLLVTPLQMAIMVSSIANYGNAIQPYLAEAVRTPDGAWTTIPQLSDQRAVTSRELAEQLRAAMKDSAQRGAAMQAAIPGKVVYGHASYALSGTQVGDKPIPGSINGGASAVSWFIGFVDHEDGTSLAVVVVLEGLRDPAAAAQIGGVALR